LESHNVMFWVVRSEKKTDVEYVLDTRCPAYQRLLVALLKSSSTPRRSDSAEGEEEEEGGGGKTGKRARTVRGKKAKYVWGWGRREGRGEGNISSGTTRYKSAATILGIGFSFARIVACMLSIIHSTLH
jgi:hypothetical protein